MTDIEYLIVDYIYEAAIHSESFKQWKYEKELAQIRGALGAKDMEMLFRELEAVRTN